MQRRLPHVALLKLWPYQLIKEEKGQIKHKRRNQASPTFPPQNKEPSKLLKVAFGRLQIRWS